MVAGLFAAIFGVFTTVAIVSHEARLADLESNQASICSAVRIISITVILWHRNMFKNHDIELVLMIQNLSNFRQELLVT